MPCERENSQLMEHTGTIKMNPKHLDVQLPPNIPHRTSFGNQKKKKSSTSPLKFVPG